ncbi:MAG TPA: glycosyltransferase family 4 protein [Miltoncostaeaceae bacterium]|nr:glycosyltransferase family 4 protein [Miltoncostaeaceae bacterium]
MTARAGRPRVLIVGPGPRSSGGVWSAIATLLRSPLAERYALRHVATHRDGGGAAKLGQAAGGLARVAAALAGRRADLVWIHTSAGASFRRKAIAAAMCRLARTPYVLHVHGSAVPGWYGSAHPLERALVRRTLRTADLVVALGPAWRGPLTGIAPCVIACVMNPVDVPAAAPRADRPAGPVVCTGRLGDHKGSAVLIRALARMPARHADTRLVLAGDGDRGPLRDEAARLGVGDRVELPGWIGAAEVGDLLGRAGVFALPSRNEGLPMALLEAMARGLPCVVTPVGAVPDLAEDRVHALFVPPDDPAALAEALTALRDDPERARALGDAARARVAALCATPVVADALDACFRGVLDGATGRARGHGERARVV